jgi:hypothetical protein
VIEGEAIVNEEVSKKNGKCSLMQREDDDDKLWDAAELTVSSGTFRIADAGPAHYRVDVNRIVPNKDIFECQWLFNSKRETMTKSLGAIASPTDNALNSADHAIQFSPLS